MFCQDCGARMIRAAYGHGAFECEDCGVVDYEEHPRPIKVREPSARERKTPRTRRERP